MISTSSLKALKNPKVLIGIGVGVGLLVAVYAALAPTLKKLGAAARECGDIEKQVEEARTMISALGGAEGEERILLQEQDVTLAINEITKAGKGFGVRFTAFTPKDMNTGGDASYRIMPIDLELESNYQALGEFLGSLDQIGKSMVRVTGLSIKPRKEDPSELKTALNLQIYLTPS